jgi:hypothetical protein
MALVALAGLVYFFVCAEPLPRELCLAPTWSKAVPPAAAELQAMPVSASSHLHSFRLTSSFGYYDDAGSTIAAATVPFGAAVSDRGYVVYDRNPAAALALKSPDGSMLSRIVVPGYPFFGGGRLFVMHPGQAAVSEIGSDGAGIWTRSFSSIVTAFDASPTMALFGLMDGTLVGLDRSGKEVLDFAPGGSRIEGIYGCAVSPDGLMAAAICGLDRQRLVVLEKRSAAYRVTWHRYLDSDFRRPVAMAFTSDGRYLAFERDPGLGVYDRGSRIESFVGSRALSGIGLYSPERDILLAIEGGDADKALLCASPRGQRLFSLPFSGNEATAALSGDAIYLCVSAADGGARLVRIDFKEE